MTDDELAPVVPIKGNVLDLDATEAQRREGRGQALEVKWRGVQYLLPVELPMDAVEQLATMADVPEIDDDADPAEAAAAMRMVSQGLDGGLAVLFCTCPELPLADPEEGQHISDVLLHEPACQWPTFKRTRPSLDTRMSLVNGVWAAYGVSLGEALAPAELPQSGGRRSAQTSAGSTSKTRATSTAGRKAPADRQPKAPAKRAAAKRAPAKRAASKRTPAE